MRNYLKSHKEHELARKLKNERARASNVAKRNKIEKELRSHAIRTGQIDAISSSLAVRVGKLDNSIEQIGEAVNDYSVMDTFTLVSYLLN